MGEADAGPRPPVDRARLEAELRRIEDRQSQLDRRRALQEFLNPTPQAERQFSRDLDVLAGARDRLAAGWDRLAAGRDAASQDRDAQAVERERALSEGPDDGLDRTTREASMAAEQDREAGRRDREAAREDRERSALDRAQSAEFRARAERTRDEQEALDDRVTAATAALGELISAEEEAALAHQLAGALLEQLALTETDAYRLGQLLRQAEQERGRARAAGERAEHVRGVVAGLVT